MIGFGTIRNTTYEAEAGELPYEDMKKSETIIPSQAGWNKGDSQKVHFLSFSHSHYLIFTFPMVTSGAVYF